MDFNTIMTAISSLGFPIVACIAIAWFFNKTNENYRADIKELQAAQKEETKALVDAVNNNTIVLTKLCEKIDKED